MKKLIAQRPIQYMGRTYERGEAIPAQDPKMVAACLAGHPGGQERGRRPGGGE